MEVVLHKYVDRIGWATVDAVAIASLLLRKKNNSSNGSLLCNIAFINITCNKRDYNYKERNLWPLLQPI